MNRTVICLAGFPIEVEHLYPSFSASAQPYRSEQEDCLFSVHISEQDLIEERKKTEAEYRLEQKPPVSFSDRSLESTAIHRKIAEQLPRYGAVVFHGSAVAVGECAYLFAARSGVGKTTHTRLWLNNIDGCFVVNGDKPILRIMDAGVYVCGTPWKGKERLGCNKMVPLKAICLLRRGEKNEIREIPFSEAFSDLLNQTYHPEDHTSLLDTLDFLKQLGGLVRFYRLTCNMEDDAAITAYEGLTHENL